VHEGVVPADVEPQRLAHLVLGDEAELLVREGVEV
jgi:hypothetical protein